MLSNPRKCKVRINVQFSGYKPVKRFYSALLVGNSPYLLENGREFHVDKVKKGCYNARALDAKAFDICDGENHPAEFVLIVMWVHLFPSRTQKLSTCTPTIRGG